IVDSPRGVARGTVTVQAHVTGGVGDAEYAAYRVGGNWIQMEKAGEGRFTSSSRPWGTAGVANGDYTVEVRVWGDVPAYEANDSNTYASQAVTVSVDNPPPAPAGVSARPGGGGVEVSWRPVATADRGDFIGYRVLGGRAPSCANAPYRQLAETSGTVFTHTAAAYGTWCYRVVALRASNVSGAVASAPSAPASVALRAARVPSTSIPEGFGGVGAADGRDAAPPAPPALGDGKLKVSDGRFDEDLPYGARRVTQEVEGRVPGALRGASDEPGVGPRQGLTLVAAGLVLATFALLLRRFLAAAPEP
ncbi:MAG TPA: hypothetical protein VG709_00120, partial [Actinomycetota bacterium]|nr:hypothetical protein [Actinomycetota bacterium]